MAERFCGLMGFSTGAIFVVIFTVLVKETVSDFNFFPLTSSKHFLSLNCICLWFLFGHLERFNVIGIKGLVLVTETFVLDVLNTETKQCKWSCEALTWKRKRKSIFV